jgi:hypothetical protein
VFKGHSASGKTRVYEVDTKDEIRVCLGEVRWYAPWRKYAFFPDPDTLYEQDCLRDIAEFLEGLMIERRERAETSNTTEDR